MLTRVISRGDKTAIELFRHGARDNAGSLTKATKALGTILVCTINTTEMFGGAGKFMFHWLAG